MCLLLVVVFCDTYFANGRRKVHNFHLLLCRCLLFGSGVGSASFIISSVAFNTVIYESVQYFSCSTSVDIFNPTSDPSLISCALDSWVTFRFSFYCLSCSTPQPLPPPAWLLQESGCWGISSLDTDASLSYSAVGIALSQAKSNPGTSTLRGQEVRYAVQRFCEFPALWNWLNLPPPLFVSFTLYAGCFRLENTLLCILSSNQELQLPQLAHMRISWHVLLVPFIQSLILVLAWSSRFGAAVSVFVIESVASKVFIAFVGLSVN